MQVKAGRFVTEDALGETSRMLSTDFVFCWVPAQRGGCD